jgi:hypothetical protein
LPGSQLDAEEGPTSAPNHIAPAAASEKTDVMATLHQFLDGANKGDMKSALAVCAAPSSIIDEFPPYAWQGATACADWATDFDSDNKKNGITEGVVATGTPKHVDITGDRAYVVVPATFSFKKNGKRTTESGSTLTVALQKVAEGWRITAWAWTKGH